MRPHHRTDAVMRCCHARDPVAERLVDRVLERLTADRHGHHLGAEHLHPGDVERLPAGVLSSHVDHAVEAEQGGRRRGGDAVLARSGLGDDALLAHPLGEQRLAEHVVDLVGAGVSKILALGEHPAAARVLGEPGKLRQQRGPGGVLAPQCRQLGLEDRIGLGRLVCGGEFLKRRHERFRRQPPAERAKMPGSARRSRYFGNTLVGRCLRRRCRHELPPRSVFSAGWEPAATRSATADLGSLPTTRLSPTSTASAPAAA